MRIRASAKVKRNRSGTTVHGWKAVLLSLPFIGFGVWMVLVGEGIAPMDDAGWSVPVSEATVIGLIFALPGLWVMKHGFGGVLEERRARRCEVRREWWMADYRWHPNRSSDGHFGDALSAMSSAALIWMLVYGLSNWHEYLSVLGWYIAGVVALVALIASLVAVGKVIHALKFGVTRLYYPGLPMELGEGVVVEIDAPWVTKHPDAEVEFELRCVQEAYVQRGENTRIECEELYNDALFGEAVGDGRYRVEMKTPAEPRWSTDLRARPPRYWEVVCRSETKGLDYQAVLLVPLYARSNQST